ncbi:tetratricopeptide repeat-containing diguanylate cyclase [Rheinheimera mangrovi]|uniref:tetratricopeptide repeat-containing diguanylate cyclase n=1 Tax=Rheinheimera mangrovi TaxID=2498451 RepID=UPI0013DF55F8|nr:GGDEF domain-containing protein [Rheinheimera mangrovi]
MWFIFLFAFPLAPVWADVFVEQLVKADQIKNTDFQIFRQQLELLKKDSGSFSDFETDYLHLLMAYEAAYMGNTEKTIELTTSLISSGTHTDISFRAKALAINSLVVARRYLDAFNYLEQLIAQLPDVRAALAREQGLMVIAMMYRYIDRYELTIEYTRILEGEKPRNTAICTARQLRLDALLASGQYDLFEQEYEQGISVCELSKNLLFATLIRLYKAQYLLTQNKDNEALRLILDSYPAAEKTHYQRLMTELNSILAQIYAKTNQNQQARHYATLVVSHNVTGDDVATLPIVNTLKVLAELNKQEKNYKQALDYHEQYMAAFTAYMDDKSAQQMAYHTAHSEIMAQNQKIALLDKDNQLLQYEQTALKHQATFNKLLIAALIVLVLGLTILAYRSYVARQRFKALAEYDDLTAISNRYHFSASAKGALALCEKGQLPAALIVFDLDHFKQINDQYGHAAGDWALRQTVDTCRNFMRNNDVFGRIGGEEFAIFLPGCQSDKAHLLADICRDAINSIDTAASGYEFKLSASFGVTSAELSGYHLTKLIEDADTAMYQAKQLGRNKVHFFNG